MLLASSSDQRVGDRESGDLLGTLHPSIRISSDLELKLSIVTIAKDLSSDTVVGLGRFWDIEYTRLVRKVGKKHGTTVRAVF